MKQILFIEPCNFVDYPLGGQLTFAVHLATAMKGNMDIVGVCTDTFMPESKWGKRRVCGFDYSFFNLKNVQPSFSKPCIPERLSSYLLLTRNMRAVLKAKEYDFIIVQAPEVLFALPGRMLAKTVLIMPGVGNPLDISRYRWARHFSRLYDILFFRRVRRVMKILPAADSNAIKNMLARSHGLVDSSKIVSFPTRYDADIFKNVSRESVRAKHNISSDLLIIVTTGRLNWYKGWKFMIDSFNIFRYRHDNAKFILLGKGEDESLIRSYIASCNMENCVELGGVMPANIVAEYLNASDLFIMGSYAEGWSTSLVEAVACATPCVVTTFSSAEELVHDGINGYVQKERNEKEFAGLMDKALLLDKTGVLVQAADVSSLSVQNMWSQLDRILQFG